jgi:CRISPR-associated endonuclease/helicase Cas3
MKPLTQTNPYIFWAKTSPDRENAPNAYHPLMCHMIDVAVVTLLMWQEVLPQAATNRIARALGLPLDLAGRVVAWIAGMHDLGKASPPFALRNGAAYLYSLYENSPLERPRSLAAPSDAPHGYVTAETLPSILQTQFQINDRLAKQIGVLIGGHHGVFPRSLDLLELGSKPGNPFWTQARNDLVLLLAEALDIPRPLELAQRAAFDHATVMLLSGLVSVADWIGSNGTYFPCRVTDFRQPIAINTEDYLVDAQGQARKALAQLGWLNWPQPDQQLSFAELFPECQPPRKVQEAAINIAEAFDSPGLVVIEAPMGEGKTEAAMYLADSWNVRLGQRGIYFALPTQATSNQMFGRVQRFLSGRFPEQKVSLQLLHGHAALSAEFETMLKRGAQAFQLTPIYNDGPGSDHHCAGNVIAAEWFTYRKRGLLAPFGVGTVDQALMAVLQTRHVFVRLFGLAHKTIIIDEVHAYDAYMSKLLERLLEWLAALGSPVVLLSATLPKARRQALLAAYRRGSGLTVNDSDQSPSESSYPRISWATGAGANEEPIAVAAGSKRTLQIEWVDGRVPKPSNEPFALGERLQADLADGGCAAVICNTVNRAQQVYAALKQNFSANELDLFHARYLFKDRAARERRALTRFGKGTNAAETESALSRPHRAVLVATQVIEQSLDLDFDLMVTDLAPVDLVLQRSGRLHRHARTRPAGLAQPVLWICEPEEVQEDVPRFDRGTELVYDAHILLRSWLALREQGYVNIPADIEPLIEAAYDDRKCDATASVELQEQWTQSEKELQATLRDMEFQAGSVIVPSPTYQDDILEVWNRRLEEDEPEIHASLQALTRLSNPTVMVVFLRPDERQRFKPDEPPTLETTREFLRHSVSLNHRGMVGNLLKQDIPNTWRRSPLLRHCRLIELDAVGCWDDGRYQMIHDPELGIVITRL